MPRRASGRFARNRSFTRRTCFRRANSSSRMSRERIDGVPRHRRGAVLLRVQAELLADPSLLRPDVPGVRRAELREAHRARRSSRPRGAADRRPREDRLSGRTQAASFGRAPHRHDTLSARFRIALLARARFRRVGRSARDLRPRPAPYAQRGGVLQRDAEDAHRGSTSSSTTPARPCAGRRRSTRT